MENILITGITGQDGIFLTHKLINKNKNALIIGISRQKNSSQFYQKLKSLGNINVQNIHILNQDLTNKRSVDLLIKDVKPNRVFNLSGPSSVYESLVDPEKTVYAVTKIFDNLTSALIENNNFCNFYQASSSEMFCGDENGVIDENSSEQFNSPYAESKLINHKKALTLANQFSWKIVSGIMFNHESEFRGSNYLTSKIITGVKNIHNKKMDSLKVGSLDYIRDWSFAGDVMNAVIDLSYNNATGSYVIGSGAGHSIKEILDIVFNHYNLNWEKYVHVDKKLLRKGDAKVKISNPEKIYQDFGWKTQTTFNDLIKRCIEKNKLIV
jgi:GDPmannose 4,6-dehydratase